MDIKKIKEYLDWQKAKKTATKVAATVLATAAIATGAMGLTSCERENVKDPDQTTIDPVTPGPTDPVTPGPTDPVDPGTTDPVEDPVDEKENWLNEVKNIDNLAKEISEGFDFQYIVLEGVGLNVFTPTLKCMSVIESEVDNKKYENITEIRFELTDEQFDKYYELAKQISLKDENCYTDEFQERSNIKKCAMFNKGMFNNSEYNDLFSEFLQIMKESQYKIQSYSIPVEETQSQDQSQDQEQER